MAYLIPELALCLLESSVIAVRYPPRVSNRSGAAKSFLISQSRKNTDLKHTLSKGRLKYPQIRPWWLTEMAGDISVVCSTCSYMVSYPLCPLPGYGQLCFWRMGNSPRSTRLDAKKKKDELSGDFIDWNITTSPYHGNVDPGGIKIKK